MATAVGRQVFFSPTTTKGLAMSCRFAFAALLLLPFPVSAQSIDLPSSAPLYTEPN
jgi:hypothetical protein